MELSHVLSIALRRVGRRRQQVPCTAAHCVHSGARAPERGETGARRGSVVRRYVHHQLSAVIEAVGAACVSAPVAFVLGGVPDVHVALWAVVVLTVLTLVFGALACTRVAWLGGERRDFETAVPLADPDRVLPAPCESLRRSLDVGFPVLLAASGVIGALLWGSPAGLWPWCSFPIGSPMPRSGPTGSAVMGLCSGWATSRSSPWPRTSGSTHPYGSPDSESRTHSTRPVRRRQGR